MKTRAIKAGFAVTALALAISPAMATELRFDGFASLVAGQVLDKDEMVVNPNTGETESFRGNDHRLNFQQNSLFALQVRADLQEKLSATAQIIAKGSQDYEAKFNWAYLTYEINNEWTAKLGRQRIPYFMYSDFLDVGYAYHWIDTPYHVYNLAGFDSLDGISLEQQVELGDWISRLTLLAGRSQTQLTAGGLDAPVDVQNQWLVAWSMNYDWLTLRATFAQSDLTIGLDGTIDGIIGGLNANGIPVTDASRTYFAVDSEQATFIGLGFSIDPGNFFIIGEATELDLNESILQSPSSQAYLSAGIRQGDFTFYATVEHVESDYSEDGVDGIMATDIDPFIPDPFRAPIRSALVDIFSASNPEEDSYSIGMRYNFHPSACFKVEYTEADDRVADKKPAAIAVAIDLVY